MAVQFDTNSDDAVITSSANMCGGDVPGLAMGWFKPESSLVAGNCFGRCGSSPGCTIHVGGADTSTLELQCPTATTAWVWRSSETGVIVLDQWLFWAFLWNGETTTDTCTVAAWAGTLESPPTQLTMNLTTTGSGNISTGGTVSWVGTSGNSVTTAQLGTHEHIAHYAFGTANVNHPIAITTAGAITTQTKDLAYSRYILPFWRGDIRAPEGVCNAQSNNRFSALIYARCGTPNTTIGLDTAKRAGQCNNALPFIGITGTGSVGTNERGPRAYNTVDAMFLWKRR